MDFLRLALKIKSGERLAYAIAFTPPFLLFFVIVVAFLGPDATGIGASALAGGVMGGLAMAALWFFTEGQINGVLGLLDYSPMEKVATPHTIERASARLVRIFSDRKLETVPLRAGEQAFYSPKPFVAVLLRPDGNGMTQASIVYDREDSSARAFAEWLVANLRIE